MPWRQNPPALLSLQSHDIINKSAKRIHRFILSIHVMIKTMAFQVKQSNTFQTEKYGEHAWEIALVFVAHEKPCSAHSAHRWAPVGSQILLPCLSPGEQNAPGYLQHFCSHTNLRNFAEFCNELLQNFTKALVYWSEDVLSYNNLTRT